MTNFAEAYRGKVREVKIEGLTIGGGNCFPLQTFDGASPNPPRILFEVWDAAPEEWSPELEAVLGEVYGDASTWIRFAAKSGADGVYLKLKSADPQGAARSIEEVAAAAIRLVEDSPLPVLVVGCGDPDVDEQLLPLVSAGVGDRRIALGNAEADTYKPVGLAARDGGEAVIAYTPMDVSLAKQLNVLLAQAGIPEEDIIMDPTCSALGYSFEYAYSVFERDRLASLTQNDVKMQAPLLANVGQETWHVKESRAAAEQLPGHGELHTRGVLWEAVSALGLILAGADAVALRHPESAGLLRRAMASFGERSDSWR